MMNISKKKRERKSKIQSFNAFNEIADIISVYSQTFSISVLSAISGTPSTSQIFIFLHYETKQFFSCSVMRLVAYHQKYTVHINKNNQMYSFSQKKKDPYIFCVSQFSIISVTPSS